MKTLGINLNRKPSFTEVWYEGSVEYDGEFYRFWLVEPQDSDYEPEVRWFNSSIPKEVRSTYTEIINMFKQIQDDRRKAKDRGDIQSY
jgi:hypothetical protein